MLKEAEDLLNQTEELAKTGTWILNLKSNQIYWSAGVYKLIESNPENFELNYNSALSVIHPDDQQKSIELMGKAINEKTDYFNTKRFICSNGKIKHILSSAKVYYDLEGNPEKMVGVFQDISKLTEIQQKEKEETERYELMLDAGTESVWEYNPQTKELFLGKGFNRNFGIQIKDKKENNDLINSLIHPEDQEFYFKSFHNALTLSDQKFWSAEYRIKKTTGDYAYVADRANIIRNDKGEVMRVIGAIKDISSDYYYKKIEGIEKNIIEKSLKKEASKEEILNDFLLQIEDLFPKMKASIVEIKEGKLYHLSGPSLDKDYADALNGKNIGPNAGSCGTAAFTKEKVIVEDTLNDYRWEKLKEVALKFNLRACWSQPIFNSDGEVIATFANYYAEPKSPGILEENCFERAKNLIGILLANFNYLNGIKKSNERYELLNKATNDAIYEWDIIKDEFIWGEGFKKIFGYDYKSKFSLKNFEDLMHPSDNTNTDWDFFINNSKLNRWEKEFRFKKSDHKYAWVQEIAYLIRDEKGKPIRMIGLLRDCTENRALQYQKQIQNKISELFKEPLKLSEILKKILEEFMRSGQFIISEIWLKNIEGNQLNLIAFNESQENNNNFYKNFKTYSKIPSDKGLPGLVYKSQKPEIWNNLPEHPSFFRKDEAKESGLNSALGIPIEHGGIKLGALILGAKENLTEDETQALLFYPLGNFLAGEITRKQQAEEMEHLFQSAPDILAIASPDGYFVKANPAFCEILGYQENEIIYKPFTNFLHPNDLNESIKEYEETITGERLAKNFLNRYKTKNGDYRWISWSSSHVFGEDNLVFSYGRDVTEFIELQKLLDHASNLAKVGAWELKFNSENNHIINWSKMTREILEVDENYIPSLSGGFEFYQKESKEKIERAVKLLIENGIEFDLELDVITQKNTLKWVRVIGKSEHLNGKCLRIFGSYQDITFKKNSEIELQKLLNEKNTILESIKDAFIAVDNNFIVTYWNHEAERVLGKKRDKTLGKNLWKLYEDAINTKFYHEYNKAINTGKTVHFEEYYESLKVWFEISAYPSENGLSIYFKDITYRKNSEEKLKQSNERFEKVSEATNDAIWDWDIVNNKVYLGKGYKTLFGYDIHPEENNMHQWAEKIHPGEKDLVNKSLNQALRNHRIKNWDTEYRYLKKDGTYSYVIDRGVIIRNNKGEAIRMVGAMNDISYRKETEEYLKQLNHELEKHSRELEISNKELEQFAYVASHDLQEPLRMVSGFLTQLDKKYSVILDDKAKQYIHFAVDGAQRMRQIILDLLEFSRAGRKDHSLSLINIPELINEIENLYSKNIEEKNAKIEFIGEKEIYHYKAPLLQIFSNLISNSIKYSKKETPPIIQISHRKENGQFLFSISDNGIGINSNYFDKIFIIFQRLHNKESYSGTGMGLAIVKKIIDGFNGKIRVESTENKGTTFYFTLPIIKLNEKN